MPTPTYDLLASTVLGSNTATVNFTNLGTVAAGYRDLVLVCMARSSGTSSGNEALLLDFNSTGAFDATSSAWDTSSTSSQTSSGSSKIENYIRTSQSSNTTPSFLIFHIFDFAQTNKHKTVLRRYDSSTYSWWGVFRWNQTSAITSINLDVEGTSTDIVAGSTFYLYGIVS